MTMPTATYRLQLRGEMTLARVQDLVPYIAGLGISHIYLSPPFTATADSTHGYDVIDPNEIDPAIGGRAAFSALAKTAKAAGLGIILDIVPNHTSFSLENRWLGDVLRHGRDSVYADHFDIDWSKGSLVLPFLPEPFEAMLARGDFHIATDDDGLGASLVCGDIAVPLAPGDLPEPGAQGDPERLRALHDAQPWRLTHWEHERDGITHRRFFNVTALIGMRVEHPAVFDDMHRLLFELIDADEVQGIRVDHVDGLVDPAAYLARLRDRVGPAFPIWVEKILTGDEPLPDWPVHGTTGYEAARAIARVLTPADGFARLDAIWRAQTGITGTFAEALQTAKAEVIQLDLAAELHQLITLARAALVDAQDVEPGDEALREAIIALLCAVPRYRSYFTQGDASAQDVALMTEAAQVAGATLRSDAVVQAIAARIVAATTPEAVALRVRFQQVTGALLAKSHEDTAGFRWNRYLAANEVGADPDEATLSIADFGDWVGTRATTAPQALTLTSSHDTKRSEDARMRLVAAAHLPDAFGALWQAANAVPGAGRVEPNLRWYIVQSMLAIWEPDRDDIPDRMMQHVEKAMREAKQVTSWPYPDEDAEGPPENFARILARAWRSALPVPGQHIVARAEQLALVQVALKLSMPGIPDMYQGTEGPSFHLTDPDNRLAVDFGARAGLTDGQGFGRDKAALTRLLLDLRRQNPVFFALAPAAADAPTPDGLRLTRQHEGQRLEVWWARGDAGFPCPDGAIWPQDVGGTTLLCVAWRKV